MNKVKGKCFNCMTLVPVPTCLAVGRIRGNIKAIIRPNWSNVPVHDVSQIESNGALFNEQTSKL